MEHIRTQLPYAVVNGIIAFAAYIIAGVTKSPAALLFAVAALVALGYKPQEASRMVSKIAKPDASSETLIREALRAAL